MNTSESGRLVAWRVVMWYRRARLNLNALEPGMTDLIEALARALGECPNDVALRQTTPETAAESGRFDAACKELLEDVLSRSVGPTAGAVRAALAHIEELEQVNSGLKACVQAWSEQRDAAEARCEALETALAEKLFPMEGRCGRGHHPKFGMDATELGGVKGYAICDLEKAEASCEVLERENKELKQTIILHERLNQAAMEMGKKETAESDALIERLEQRAERAEDLVKQLCEKRATPHPRHGR